MLIDTHCHLDAPDFDADRDVVWQRALDSGVHAVVIPAVAPSSWDRTRAMARPGQRFVTLGIHPQALPDLTDADVDDALDALPGLARACHAVAIGECGLDGSLDPARASLERQRRVLQAHGEIARALDLPLVVHVVRAHADAVALLPSLPASRRVPGVIHSYSGGADLARVYLAHGFHLAFGGAVTRPRARRPVAAARIVPLDRLLLETDAPDQPPTGAFPSGPTGRRCEPAHLHLTATRLAEVRGDDRDALIEHTGRNAIALFGLGS